jgi:hypothetical protein
MQASVGDSSELAATFVLFLNDDLSLKRAVQLAIAAESRVTNFPVCRRKQTAPPFAPNSVYQTLATKLVKIQPILGQWTRVLSAANRCCCVSYSELPVRQTLGPSRPHKAWRTDNRDARGQSSDASRGASGQSMPIPGKVGRGDSQSLLIGK